MRIKRIEALEIKIKDLEVLILLSFKMLRLRKQKVI